MVALLVCVAVRLERQDQHGHVSVNPMAKGMPVTFTPFSRWYGQCRSRCAGRVLGGLVGKTAFVTYISEGTPRLCAHDAAGKLRCGIDLSKSEVSLKGVKWPWTNLALLEELRFSGVCGVPVDVALRPGSAMQAEGRSQAISVSAIEAMKTVVLAYR